VVGRTAQPRVLPSDLVVLTRRFGEARSRQCQWSLTEKFFENFFERARNEIVPRSVSPPAARGVAKRQVALPCVLRPLPWSVALPSLAVHETSVGRTGVPPAVTCTVAATLDPAAGAVGVTFALLADAELLPLYAGALTWNWKVAVLFAVLGSGSAGVTVAVTLYVPA
jgi:hypothetical protein